ncbi:TetR-like C-terminal domain-containing protein [Caldifermentibacillus hisashii]|uniref:TetR/AcrR family transcriptional regulator n=1 Tax=Caldifermentibacillus hisashii TaxID=996558 RepID=UPI0031B6CF94
MTVARRINKSKTALKEALLILMENKDYNKITITDIVNISNLNRGTFYKHYQTKEELLEELIGEVIADLIRSYREPYLQKSKLEISDLSSSSIKIFEHVYLYGKFYKIIIHSNALPGFQSKICQVLKNLVLQDLSTKNDLNKNINPEIFSSYFAYAIFGIIVEWVDQNFSYTPTYMSEQLIRILSYTTIIT